MPPLNPAESPPGRVDPDEILDRFEAAWRDGPPPAIDDFLRLCSDPASRRKLLADLATIHLEYQWRHRSTGARLRLIEDYLARYPELGAPADLLCRLIGAEYRVRQRWGDRPGHAEYAVRFPQHAAALRPLLERIDTELALEQKPRAVDAPPAPAAATTVAELLDGLRRCGLLALPQLNEMIHGDAQGRFADARVLARELVQRGWSTPYQVNQLLRGRAGELTLGAYVLLERLGEGGAGQVFKARHRHLDRLVALKLIRKENLQAPEAVARFQREIKAIGQLDHPNIVRACDGGPLGNSFYLAMDYVEGTDLARLVKTTGRLAVPQAIDYVCQAALGLQYIHEHGLVHRDIKPSNILVTTGAASPVVKILDLGLVRILRSWSEQGPTLTEEGAVMMGTLDYMAPEQALDFHQADIRSDIYSLGCSFFYLLAGRAPFADGTPAQKLIKHQQAEPPAVEAVRPEVPALVAQVVRKMMAKRPEDRYQTPLQVVQALAPPATLLPVPAGSPVLALPVVRMAGSGSAPLAIVIDGRAPVPFRLRLEMAFGRLRRFSGSRRRRTLGAVVAVALLLLVGLTLAAALSSWKDQPVFLADLPEKVIQVGHIDGGFAKGKEGKDRSDRAFPTIRVNGDLFYKGLFTFPNAQVEYQLDGQYRRFKAKVAAVADRYGIDALNATVDFAVIGDGRVLWRSKSFALSSHRKGAEVEETPFLNVRQVGVLHLVVNGVGEPAFGWYKCFWLDPYVMK